MAAGSEELIVREREMKTPKILVESITNYLSSGGLFNPELADHDAVRELLRDCRDVLSQYVDDKPHLGMLNLRAQGDAKRALFVCSGGMLRSATSAHWAAENLGWNTRSAGTRSDALPPVHRNLLQWAEVVYVMEERHQEKILKQFSWISEEKIKILDVPDIFEYRSPRLHRLLEQRFSKELDEQDPAATPIEPRVNP